MNPGSNIVVILDNIRSALNVGAIFRTSDAAGIKKLYLNGITPYPPHNKIPKTALGATENVKWQYEKDSQTTLSLVQKENPGGELVSIELTEKSVDIWDYKFTPNTVLVLGHEINGVSDFFLNNSSAVVKIPMFGMKESLNVSVAYGIVIYEVVRQLSQNPQ